MCLNGTRKPILPYLNYELNCAPLMSPSEEKLGRVKLHPIWEKQKHPIYLDKAGFTRSTNKSAPIQKVHTNWFYATSHKSVAD